VLAQAEASRKNDAGRNREMSASRAATEKGEADSANGGGSKSRASEMPAIQVEVSIAAGGINNNLFAGSAFEFARTRTLLSLGVTAPLLGIATTAISSAADFQQSMNIMQTVSGATGDQMARMQQQALDLGAQTSFSAGEAAKGMLELSKSGMKAEDIMAAMPGVLDLAAAGGLDVGQAAEIASNALNSFHLPASKAKDVANLFAAAANASSIEVTDMAQSMSQASAVACWQ